MAAVQPPILPGPAKPRSLVYHVFQLSQPMQSQYNSIA